MLRRLANVFDRVLANERCLGNPSRNEQERLCRMSAMAAMTGGRGFRVPPKGPKLSKGGKTRKQLISDGVIRPRLLKVRP